MFIYSGDDISIIFLHPHEIYQGKKPSLGLPWQCPLLGHQEQSVAKDTWHKTPFYCHRLGEVELWVNPGWLGMDAGSSEEAPKASCFSHALYQGKGRWPTDLSAMSTSSTARKNILGLHTGVDSTANADLPILDLWQNNVKMGCTLTYFPASYRKSKRNWAGISQVFCLGLSQHEKTNGKSIFNWFDSIFITVSVTGWSFFLLDN